MLPNVGDPCSEQFPQPQPDQLQNLSEVVRAAGLWVSLRGEESLQVLKKAAFSCSSAKAGTHLSRDSSCAWEVTARSLCSSSSSQVSSLGSPFPFPSLTSFSLFSDFSLPLVLLRFLWLCPHSRSPSPFPCSLHMPRHPRWLELLLPSLERTSPELHHSRPVARQRSITWILLSQAPKLQIRGIFLLLFQRGPSPASLAALRGLQRSLLPLLQLLPLPPHLPAWHLGSHTQAPSGHSPTWSGAKPWNDAHVPQGMV